MSEYYLDGNGSLRKKGEPYYDSQGILRESEKNSNDNNLFYDGLGILRKNGDLFFDNKGNLKESSDPYYDKNGFLREQGKYF